MKFEEFKSQLHGWFAFEHTRLYRDDVVPAPRGTILLGCSVYGDKYIERFENLTLKTILSPSNVRALKGRTRFVLFTTAEDYDKLWRLAQRLQAEGFPTRIWQIPPELVAYTRKTDDPEDPEYEPVDSKLALLGGVQNLLVQIAARYGMAFHALFPDHLYSANYFANLFRLSKKYPAIVQSSISANDGESIRGEFAKYMLKNGTLEFPGVDLVDIGFQHLHPQSFGNMMNKGEEVFGYPSSFQVIWQGRDRLHLHCCHTNAVYLSPELCVAAPVRYFSPLDCNLPYIMGEEFYAPTIADDMTFIELSDEGKAGIDRRVGIELFAAVCWAHVKFRMIYLPYFQRGNEMPIKPQEKYLEAADIKQRHDALVHDVVNYREIVRGRVKYRDKTVVEMAA